MVALFAFTVLFGFALSWLVLVARPGADEFIRAETVLGTIFDVLFCMFAGPALLTRSLITSIDNAMAFMVLFALVTTWSFCGGLVSLWALHQLQIV